MLREQWLRSALDALRPDFAACGASVPDVRLSIGFPSRGATSARQRRIGECWDRASASDQHYHVFVSPLLDNPLEVLGVLVHELVHACVGCKVGHKGPFKRLATQMGLTGKMTATKPGESLTARLNALSAELGPFPSGALNIADRKKQGTRLLKAMCPACGAIIRLTAKVIESPGLPRCACSDATFEVTTET